MIEATVAQILALAVFLGAYVLIAGKRVRRVAAAFGGAALMLALVVAGVSIVLAVPYLWPRYFVFG